MRSSQKLPKSNQIQSPGCAWTQRSPMLYHMTSQQLWFRANYTYKVTKPCMETPWLRMGATVYDQVQGFYCIHETFLLSVKHSGLLMENKDKRFSRSSLLIVLCLMLDFKVCCLRGLK